MLYGEGVIYNNTHYIIITTRPLPHYAGRGT